MPGDSWDERRRGPAGPPRSRPRPGDDGRRRGAPADAGWGAPPPSRRGGNGSGVDRPARSASGRGGGFDRPARTRGNGSGAPGGDRRPVLGDDGRLRPAAGRGRPGGRDGLRSRDRGAPWPASDGADRARQARGGRSSDSWPAPAGGASGNGARGNGASDNGARSNGVRGTGASGNGGRGIRARGNGVAGGAPAARDRGGPHGADPRGARRDDAAGADPWGTRRDEAVGGGRRQLRVASPSGGLLDGFGGSGGRGTGGPGGPGGWDGGRDGPRHARDDDGDLDSGRRGRRSWLQRMVLVTGIVVVLVCLLGSSVAGYVLVKYNSIDRVDDLDLPSAAAGEPENYLIVAVDTREGHSAVNTDTIMVARVDPKSDRLALTSFPRDLMVTAADTGELGMLNAVYNRPNGAGPGNLIETLQENYGITINHFVEVNFQSFQQVVDAVGGVTIWLDKPARDRQTAFNVPHTGCIWLDGDLSLHFVRSRKFQVQIDGEWRNDPKSDEHRVQRQQVFVQRALAKALSTVKSDPRKLQDLVNIGVSNVKLDPNLGIGDVLDLGQQFQDFDASTFETYPLPVSPWPQNENRLVLDEAAAEPVLNVFRGLPPGEISPGRISVQVLNGTVAADDPAQQREGLATDVSGALQHVGFDMRQADDADTFYAQTTIQHAPGQEMMAQRVARHITSEVAIPTEPNPELASGQVRVIAGFDFTTVHEVATPIEQMPAPAGAPPVDTTAPADTTTTTAPPPTTTTTQNPFIVGSAPEGEDC